MNYSTSLAIGIKECYGKIRKVQNTNVFFYPNPAKSSINISALDNDVITGVKCFNTSGQQVPVSFEPSDVNNQVYFDLPAGLYMLQMKTDRQQYVIKFIVQP